MQKYIRQNTMKIKSNTQSKIKRKQNCSFLYKNKISTTTSMSRDSNQTIDYI